jgi:diguanylate cyclase (GGDEF)-like protein
MGESILKINEFAELNHVTSKMLRHYDEIGLLKPKTTDPASGYRLYGKEQTRQLAWIQILKNLSFSLAEIKEILRGPVSSKKLLDELKGKRIRILSSLNEHHQKKLQIDRFIQLLERDEVQMDKLIELLELEQDSVHELKKNMPNLEVFLENTAEILASCADTDPVAVLRFDIARFKQVNDNYGFDVGDRVILVCYEIIREAADALGKDACVGRTHGDEFILFMKADGSRAGETAEQMVKGIESFPFSSVGCHSKVGCTIGLLYTVKEKTGDIRGMIEDTLDTINEARKGGPNTILRLPYPGRM